MNPEPEDDLRALFDSTATEANGPILTKLKARALDIPQTARRRWWVRFTVPAFALVAGVAAAAFLLKAAPVAPGPALESPAALATLTPTNTASAESAVPVPEQSVVEQSDDDLEGLEALAWGDSDDLWSGAGVDPDVESDELLAALDSWMEEDG